MKLMAALKHLKFRTRLLVSYLLLVALFVVAVGAGLYYYSAIVIKEEVINFASISVQQINKNVDRYIEELSRLSSITISDQKLQEVLKSTSYAKSTLQRMNDSNYIFNFLFNLYSFRPGIYSLYLVTNTGEAYVEGFNRYIETDYDITEEPWYQELIKSPRKLYVIGPREAPHIYRSGSPVPVFSVAKRIIGIDGASLGTIIINIEYKSFKDLFVDLEKDHKAKVVAFNPHEKRILYNSDPGGDSGNFLSYLNQNYERIISNDGIDHFTDDKGIRTLIISDSSQYTGWDTVMFVSEAELYKKLVNIRTFLFLLLSVCVIAIIVLSSIISSAVTKPVRKLTELMGKVEMGNFNVTMDIDSNDEIGRLSRGFNSMISRINTLVNQMVEVEIKTKESELMALQSQINPHFLYNTLESIRMRCIVKKERDIAKIIHTLGNLFKLSIDRGEKLVPLRDEIEHIKSYVAIQNFRYDNKYKLIIEADELLMDYMVPKLILQPLVENSIYHGLEIMPGNGLVRVKINNEDGVLRIIIEDNGLGMDEEHLLAIQALLVNKTDQGDKRGIGLRNVNDRIRLFFGSKYGLDIQSRENQGTRVTIALPAFKDKNEVKLYV